MINELPVVGKRYKHKEDGFVIKVKSVELCRNNYFIFPEEKMSGWQWEEFLELFEELPDSNPQEVSEIDRALEELKEEITLKQTCKGVGKEPNALLDGFFRLYDKAQNLVNALEAEKARPNPEPAVDENEQAYYEAISKYPKGIKAHSFYPYEPCKCCSDPKAYAEYMSKPEPKIDIKEERVEPVSIWKDVSELPYNYAKVILKIKTGTNYYLGAFFKDGEFYDEELSDFENLPIRKEAIWKWCFKNDPLKTLEQIQKDIEELKRKST